MTFHNYDHDDQRTQLNPTTFGFYYARYTTGDRIGINIDDADHGRFFMELPTEAVQALRDKLGAMLAHQRNASQELDRRAEERQANDD